MMVMFWQQTTKSHIKCVSPANVTHCTRRDTSNAHLLHKEQQCQQRAKHKADENQRFGHVFHERH